MDTILNAKPVQHENLRSEISAIELPNILDEYQNKLSILSLDCFDTLIWRKTAKPKDVFQQLNHKFHFSSTGLSAKLRERAESEARRNKKINCDSSEITLEEIYQTALPHANINLINTLVEEEFETELENCYAFQPAVLLLKNAIKRNIPIIIVSDIYYQEDKLRRLLKAKLPAEIYAGIKAVFCSCDFGLSKSEGLFHHVLKKINKKSNTILHVGDHHTADYLAPKVVGMHSVKFSQFSQGTMENLRLQTISAAYVNANLEDSHYGISPFRPILSLHQNSTDSGEYLIGYNTLGPIMFSFAAFILSEITRLTESGKKVKALFLMRDGYLPALACEALAGKKIGYNVRISRFAAIAATFRSVEDINRYVTENAPSLRFADLCRQLLLDEKSTQKICQQTLASKNKTQTFVRLIQHKDTVKQIITASSAYRKRLYKYLETQAKLESGETALFVDLGYTGTAQKLLEQVFIDELNIAIQGCYLIALRVPNWQQSRTGLLDPTHYDDNTLGMLVTHIPIIEQLVTSNEKSVVDYSDSGEPIFSEAAVNARQYAKLDAIQAQALQFIRDANTYFTQSDSQPNLSILRQAAAINLARLIFLPTVQELQYLRSFEFEVNMGTDDVISLFDIEKGVEGLRRRGWLNCAKTNTNKRANYAAEWRAANIELALTLMAQHRFNLEFSLNDMSHRYQSITISVLQHNQTSQMILQATPTHDGYYSLMIPVVNQDYQIAIQFGLRYQWIELDHAEIIKLTSLYSPDEAKNSVDAAPSLMLHAMENKGGGLYECASIDSLVIFSPPADLEKEAYVMRFIFRPIVYRDDQSK